MLKWDHLCQPDWRQETLLQRSNCPARHQPASSTPHCLCGLIHRARTLPPALGAGNKNCQQLPRGSWVPTDPRSAGMLVVTQARVPSQPRQQ